MPLSWGLGHRRRRGVPLDFGLEYGIRRETERDLITESFGI